MRKHNTLLHKIPYEVSKSTKVESSFISTKIFSECAVLISLVLTLETNTIFKKCYYGKLFSLVSWGILHVQDNIECCMEQYCF